MLYSKSTKLNRLSEKRMERVGTVAKLWLQGKPLRAIAELTATSTAQIRRDLKHAKALWKESTMATLDGLLSVELARIDQVEAEAWRGWFKSQEATKETMVEKGKDSEGTYTKRQLRKRQQIGMPDFLKIALNCVEMRVRILSAIKEENGENDDIVVQAVEVIVDNREQAKQMLEFEDFRKIVKQ